MPHSVQKNQQGAIKMNRPKPAVLQVKNLYLRLTIFSVAALALMNMLTPLEVKSQTQAEMNRSADAEFKKADAELNRIYKKLMLIHKDAESAPVREAIINAQQAWIKYRDLSVQAVLKVYEGGSMAPMQASGLMTALTKNQTAILRQYLPQDDDDAPSAKP
jgi:uncharacterized protein YecT (DUF1311 family)